MLDIRALLVGASVAVCYVVLVPMWIDSAGQSAMDNFAAMMATAPEGLDGDDLTNWLAVQEHDHRWSPLLTILLFPVVLVTSSATQGNVPFFAVLAQSILWGALGYWLMRKIKPKGT
ncbi:hypothetical protein [Roseobacter sp. MH60115]|uniref:hypothetical protein n=1 Tax=Roseobacter sp. MH60115 TaxID=2785324 RepID=UPI0018A29905|nr:hypothetical protein [Roseobacter sp. MH60115]